MLISRGPTGKAERTNVQFERPNEAERARVRAAIPRSHAVPKRARAATLAPQPDRAGSNTDSSAPVGPTKLERQLRVPQRSRSGLEQPIRADRFERPREAQTLSRGWSGHFERKNECITAVGSNYPSSDFELLCSWGGLEEPVREFFQLFGTIVVCVLVFSWSRGA